MRFLSNVFSTCFFVIVPTPVLFTYQLTINLNIMQLKAYMMPDLLPKNVMSITKFYRDQEGVRELQGTMSDLDSNLTLHFCMQEDELSLLKSYYHATHEFDYHGIQMKCVVSSPRPLDGKDGQIEEQFKRYTDFLDDTFKLSD